MRRTLLVGWLLLALMVFTLPGLAQSIYANLSGTVTDNTGALVPGADITVTDANSGAARKTVSNSTGYFSVPSLPAGTYNVAVNAKGFGKYEVKGIALNSSESKSMNIALKVEAVQETIDVAARMTELATIDSADRAHTITSKDVQELSLVGRNAIEFLKIVPGAGLRANDAVNRPASDGQVVGINGFAPGNNAGGLDSFRINGQSVDITMDGQHSFDPGASGSATPVNPNPDMIAELTVNSSNYTAESRTPVNVNTVTKGGGKDFHGSAYLYARNSAMNAEEQFNKEAEAASSGSLAPGSLKVPSSYYYPGFNIGGPVLIPGTGFNKSRQKVFFFDGLEFYRQNLDAGLNRAFVPTEAMLNGDFRELTTWNTANNPGWRSGPVAHQIGALPVTPTGWLGFNQRVANPFGGVACTIAGGVISSGCISPQAQLLLRDYLPAPNADPTETGFNYVNAMTVPQHSWQNVARVDWNISDNTKVYVNWSRQRESANMPMGLWIQPGDWVVPAPSNSIGKNGSDTIGASLLHVFSPTMTAEARFGYTKINFPTELQNPEKQMRADLGYTSTGIYGTTNAPAVLAWGGTFPNLGDVGHYFHPTMIAVKGIPSVQGNLTKVFGSHTTKYGFYYDHTYNKQDNWGQYMGVFGYGATGWGGGASGNEYADALMGIGHTGYFEQAVPPPTNLAQNIAAFYAQDHWKLNRHLTLDYGMRFEHIAKPYSAQFGLAVFDPAAYDTRFNDPLIAPTNTQSGISWHALDSSIPVSGAESRFLFFSPRFGFAFDVFGNTNTVIRGGWGKSRTYDSVQSNSYVQPAQTATGSAGWSCGRNDAVCPTWESVDAHAQAQPTYGTGLPTGIKQVFVTDAKNDEQPMVTSYSLTLDQKLPGKFNLELAYVGNRSKYLQAYTNINAVPLGAINATSVIPFATLGCDTVGNWGNQACLQNFRQYGAYTQINQAITAGATQYDSLQTSLTRTIGNFTLQGNYTFSKAMGNGVQIANGGWPGAISIEEAQRWLWGILPNNRAHVLSLAYVFRMPKVNGNAALRAFADGWEISGITQLQSGAQLSAQSGTNLNWNLNQGGDNQDNTHLLGSPDITLYPQITCNPISNLNENQFLNPSCFVRNPAGELGTASMPYMPGPKFFSSDLTLMKNFKLTERQGLQFRFMAFNFLNHSLLSYAPNDNNLRLAFDDTGYMITGTGCKAKHADNPGGAVCTQPTTFGIASHHYGRRIIELGIKYTF